MKLKKGFITRDIDDSQVMVAAGEAIDVFRGIAKSNHTAAFIVNSLKKETTQEEIVKAILDEYDFEDVENPGETVQRDVEKILGQLRDIGALEE